MRPGALRRCWGAFARNIRPFSEPRTVSNVKDFFSDYLFLSFAAFLLSVVCTPIIRRTCERRAVLDFPTLSRKIHTNPVPRLGGIAIYLAFFLPLFAIFLIDGRISALFARRLDILLSLFFTSTLVFAIGVYDDIRGATVVQKFSVECLAAIIIYFLGFQSQLITIPFVGSGSLGVLGFPVTILWIVGVTNAINFIDGVDGLAGGVGLFSVSTMFILALFLQSTLTACFAAALAGGLLGFLLYNFAPASIFMGDSGSLFVGFTIAAISLYGSQKSSTVVVLLIPIVALGFPIVDTILAIIRRLGNGQSPFRADREHIHHRLLQMGLSSRQVALIVYVICILLGIIALLMTAVNNQVLTLLLIVLSAMTIGGIKMLGYSTDVLQINALARARIQQKRRLLRQQRFADELLTEMQVAGDLLTLQKSVLRYFEYLEFDTGKLRLAPAVIAAGQAPEKVFWESPGYADQTLPVDQLWTMTVPLVVETRTYGELCVGKYLQENTSLLEISLLVDNLKSALESALARIVPQ
ncbi:undecaprenyl/decaprenyl-phosphate alpha-N-acetylglucosaminyl 1-phosphate transferase [candidate division KSB3 bacterium]|uniref:Undecaprenyl/decaprenyl-phosphate alpha-N-acetylglucosaminyl 1-phosphate transferase n=1 Tax=candidate division KSB3 bacterium TaxID=2044937 RepID=A0A9D5JV62_9BACT|nr:undecaprenyl/decaprenyl-phosphate alpha-N-acetylglucosaminyl 1-phosphate transferase [candidate division KSB3 bacterium]MBD3324709.1 undecaprenyl/decaprenyl-phosphate alpha-N-acetylglucosaminyl 1-phosphate transferase [candidate division KSB3 bacterium]